MVHEWVVKGSAGGEGLSRWLRAQLVESVWCRAQLVVHEWVMEGSAGGEGVV